MITVLKVHALSDNVARTLHAARRCMGNVRKLKEYTDRYNAIDLTSESFDVVTKFNELSSILSEFYDSVNTVIISPNGEELSVSGSRWFNLGALRSHRDTPKGIITQITKSEFFEMGFKNYPSEAEWVEIQLVPKLR